MNNQEIRNLVNDIRDNGIKQHIEQFGFHDTSFCIVCKEAELKNFPEAVKAV